MKATLILMSDSHGYNEPVTELIRMYPKADAYIHCGDICEDLNSFPLLTAVKGNNDYGINLPNELIIHIGGIGIYVVHSHRIYSWDRHGQLAMMAKEKGCQMTGTEDINIERLNVLDF